MPTINAEPIHTTLVSHRRQPGLSQRQSPKAIEKPGSNPGEAIDGRPRHCQTRVNILNSRL